MPDEQIRSAVRAELARKGVSARAMNERLGWGRHHLTRRLAGEVEFRTSELQALAVQLEVPLSRLVDPPRDEVPSAPAPAPAS